MTSGSPVVFPTSAYIAATWAASAASQRYAFAPVSVHSAARLAGLRDASATFIPSRANSRAREALRPEPAPTINAVWYFIASCYQNPILDMGYGICVPRAADVVNTHIPYPVTHIGFVTAISRQSASRESR